MPTPITLIRVLVSSPEDMASARRAARSAVDELNNTALRDLGIRLEVFSWESHGSPDFASDPQAVLNRQLTEFDIYIGMLGHTFGTPTPRASSGTAEEFTQAYNRWKADNKACRLMFYFSEAPISPSQIDPEQLRRVQQFRSQLGSLGGLYWTFRDHAELPELLRRHLLQAVRDFGNTWGLTIEPYRKDKSIAKFAELVEDEPTLFDLISRS